MVEQFDRFFSLIDQVKLVFLFLRLRPRTLSFFHALLWTSRLPTRHQTSPHKHYSMCLLTMDGVKDVQNDLVDLDVNANLMNIWLYDYEQHMDDTLRGKIMEVKKKAGIKVVASQGN